MKRIFSLIISVCTLVSCEHLVIPSGEETQNSDQHSSATHQVTILTRSTTNDIQYPITVYAFNSESGMCCAEQSLDSPSENLSLSLSKGQYHIIALSNTTEYSLPNSPEPSSIVRMKEDSNYSSTPLQMGQADITVGNTNQNVNIVLSYKVAILSLALSNIPSNISAVNFTIAQQSSSVNLKGEFSGEGNITVPLTKTNNGWYANNICIFPGFSNNCAFTITLEDSEHSVSYGYNYSAQLKAATPYNLSGTFASDMINISGEFTNEGWNEAIDVDFSFGPDNRPDNDSNLPTFYVSSFPEAGSVWNDYIIAYAYYNDVNETLVDKEELHKLSQVNMLLLSKSEWSDVASSISKTNPEQMTSLISSFEEGSLTGWNVPTSAEAKILKSLYNENTIESLNNTISSANGTRIIPLDSKGENRRYLCEDGNYTFAWKASSPVSKAGATINYALRLVNHIRMVKKE